MVVDDMFIQLQRADTVLPQTIFALGSIQIFPAPSMLSILFCLLNDASQLTTLFSRRVQVHVPQHPKHPIRLTKRFQKSGNKFGAD